MLALLNTMLVGFVLAYLRNKLLLPTLATVINMGVFIVQQARLECVTYIVTLYSSDDL